MIKRLSLLSLALLLVFIAGITLLLNSSVAAQPQAKGIAYVLVTLDPRATATATPFQPVGPTAVPTRTPTLAPTPTAVISYPTAAGGPSVGTVNIMILGTDQRADPGFRTDVMMLVSVNTTTGTVSVISFPRDLYVTIPGWMQQRINTAFSAGGFPTLANTLQYNFRVRPQYYFLTNFQGFAKIIDDLDGIAVNASAPLTDKCDLPRAKNGYCTVNPGKVVMDGKTALWYVRSRHSTSDFDRTRRAQEVLYAIFTRMMKFNAITRLPELYTQLSSGVETNMGIADMLPLLPVAGEVLQNPERIHRYAVTPRMVSNFITSDGAMVLLPNYYAISAMLQQALAGQ